MSARKLDHYRLEVDVNDGPGMQRLVDIVADGLEDLGYSDGDYSVVVHGPPELRLGVVHK